jgi:serine/threonine protein kinase
LKRLDHPSLPRIYDIFEDEKHTYIIVDYIEGVPLDKKLREEGKFSEQRVVGWGIQLCDVLSYLHGFTPRPIIYRDIKPSNIILTGEDKLKLVDFGIAREYKPGNPDDTVYIGTRGYAAPEQYGGGQTSTASDIYSLGVTLHHLVTGVGPDRVTCEVVPIRELDEGLSEEFEAIISKCTRKRPEERYTSAAELKAALRAIQSAYVPEKSGPGINTSIRTYRRTVFTVWGNPEFACEFAYMCAKLSGLSVLLMDLDLLSPSVDLLLNVPKYPACQHKKIIKNTGLNLLCEAAAGNRIDTKFFTQVSLRRRELDNLFIVTGSYNIDDYEYYSDEILAQVIDDAYRSFDITILIINSFIYDAFTVVALARSDCNIISTSADILSLRTYNNCREFLAEKQNIQFDKYKFVVFDREPGSRPDRALLETAVGDAYIGRIRYSGKRNACRNLKKAYAKVMEREVAEDYRKLLARLGIIPRETFIHGLIGRIRGGATYARGF